MRYNPVTLWDFMNRLTHWCLGPAFITAIQPTLFHGCCSYLEHPLALVGAYNISSQPGTRRVIMFMYRYPRRRPQFPTTFWISFIFGRIDGSQLQITWLDFCLFFFLALTLNSNKVKYAIFYISAKKWSDCHKTNNRYINRMICLKCDHECWSWP